MTAVRMPSTRAPDVAAGARVVIPPSRTGRRWVAAAVLVGVWALAVVLVDPRADVPLIDDWTYAMSVERLLAGRGFAVAAWSSTFPAAQIAWGTLFAAAAGFSYTALRASTLVLAIAGTLAFYGLLRVLGCGRDCALVGALTLALYPVAFVLSFTFMTDVPALTAMVASLAAIAAAFGARARAEERGGVGVGWLTVGLALALVAFLIRPVAIAIPAAVLATLFLHRNLRGRRRVVVALVVLTGAAMAATTVAARPYWSPAVVGDGGLAYRLDRIRYLLLVSPWIYAEALLSMLAHIGLAVLPALVATAGRARRWPWRLALALGAAAIVVSFVTPQAVSALRPRATWSTQELGAARPLLVGDVPYGAGRAALALVATAAGVLAAACLLARTARGLRRGGALRTPAGTFVVAFAATSIAVCFALWFFYDRYYLPIVPAAIAIALVASRGAPIPRVRAAASGMVLVALFILDVTGTRDMLAYGRAVDAALARLVATGVALQDVDAGYVENGWQLYAHPENLPPGTNVDRAVPHVTGTAAQSYALANSPLPGYAVRALVPVARAWAATDTVYVLERERASPEQDPPPAGRR